MIKKHKTWPKIQKDFSSFLTKDEQSAVIQAETIDNKNSASFFDNDQPEIEQIQNNKNFYLCNMNNPYKNTFLEALFEIFYSQAFLQGDKLFANRNGSYRKWTFEVRPFVLNNKNAPLIFDAFWEKMKDKYPFQVTGETVAGAIFAQLISLEAQHRGIDINATFVREERKQTGLQKHLEGVLNKHPVIIVDDLFNSGGTVLHTLKILEREKLKIAGLFAFINYENPEGQDFLKKHPIEVNTFFTLADFGVERGKRAWTRIEIAIDPIWKKESPEENLLYAVPKSNPCQDEEKIYYGTHSGYFFAMNKQDGSEAWKFKTGEHIQKKSILSSPILYKEQVIFGSYDGNLYSLDKSTGEILWIFDEAEWIGSSPCISEKHNMIFIGMEYGIPTRRGGVSAVNASTGEKIWEDFFENYVHCSPAYCEELDVVIIGSNCGFVRLYDASTGKKYWELEVGREVKMNFAFDVVKGIVCFGAFDGKEYIVDVSSGRVLRTIQTEGVIYTSPLIHKEILYFTSTDKNLYGFDLKSKNVSSQFTTSGKILCNPTAWENYIVFGSNDGRVYFIDFEQSKCFFIQFSERITSQITFDNTHCYIQDFTNQMFCYTIKDIKKAMSE